MHCLVFNHDSLPFQHASATEQAVPKFIKICIKAQNAGLKTMLIDQQVDKSWFRLKLAPKYFFQDWYNSHKDLDKYRDIVRAFRAIATKSPLFSSEDINNNLELFEVRFNNRKDYTAVQAAAWHEAPLASFAAEELWQTSPLRVCITTMNPKTSEIENENAEIPNFYNYSVFLKEQLPKIKKQRDEALDSSKEILKNFSDYYPGLSLCGKAKGQLNSPISSSTLLKQIKQSLKGLSDLAVKWKNKEYCCFRANYLHQCGISNISGESETVENNPNLKKEREFFLPNGQKKYFSQHIKMSSGFRLHFFPDNESRQIFVGYIGPHLRTK